MQKPWCFEITDHMLAHLTGPKIHEDGLTYNDTDSDTFSKKDIFLMAEKYIGENLSLPEMYLFSKRFSCQYFTLHAHMR